MKLRISSAFNIKFTLPRLNIIRLIKVFLMIECITRGSFMPSKGVMLLWAIHSVNQRFKSCKERFIAESWENILRSNRGNANEASEESSHRQCIRNEHQVWQRLTGNTDERGGQLETKRSETRCKADQAKVLGANSQLAVILTVGGCDVGKMQRYGESAKAHVNTKHETNTAMWERCNWAHSPGYLCCDASYNQKPGTCPREKLSSGAPVSRDPYVALT